MLLMGGVDEYEVAPPLFPFCLPFDPPANRIGTAPAGVGVVGEAERMDAGEAARLSGMGDAARLPPGLL